MDSVKTPKVDSQITFLYTPDLNKTAHFYESIMGFELALDQGTCRIYQVSKSGYLGFCEKARVSEDQSNIIFTIVTPEVDQWYQRLKARGVIFDGPPQENPKYRIYHCFLRDPNGYLIEIQAFLDPRWDQNKVN